MDELKLQEQLAAMKDELRDYADQRRNEVFKILSGASLIVAVLSYFGVQGVVKGAVEEIGTQAIVEAKVDAQRMADSIGQLHAELIENDCIERRTFYKCFHETNRDNLTWVSDDSGAECPAGSWEIEGAIEVFAPCAAAD